MIQNTSLFSLIGILYTALVSFVIADSATEQKDNKVVIKQMQPLVRIDSIDTTTTTTTVAEVPTSKKALKQISSDKTERCPEWEDKFSEYGLPTELFSYIAYRESRCNPKAVNAKWDSQGNVIWTLNKNGSIDRGLLQINSSWRTVTRNICSTNIDGLYDVDCNLSVAKYLYDNGGAGHWSIRE